VLLKKLKRYMDEELKISEFEADLSLNGLQVEGSRTVRKVTLAVDACDIAIRKAARNGSEMLIVHHGLFWGGPEPVTGILKRRIELLIKNGISLYAAHLPLDCHPVIGNNAMLASKLGLKEPGTFGIYKGKEIGICGSLARPLSPRGLAGKIGKILSSRIELFPFGPSRISRIGIVSGGGSQLAPAAAEAGCQALFTGESSHSAYHPAREARINLVCGGHYATETVGLIAFGDLLEEKFGLKTTFADVPTGL
jgi:dinuclear metal center YbgI/SA1388 family protein